jgi:hypothetical protein
MGILSFHRWLLELQGKLSLPLDILAVSVASSLSGLTLCRTVPPQVLFDVGLPATSIKRRRLHFDRADEASTTPNSAFPGGACNAGARDASPR